MMARSTTAAPSKRARPPVPCMSVPAVKRPRGKPFAPHNKGLRARAWWLMRKQVRFTLDDLLFTVAKNTEGDATSNLQKYVSALERVGVLVRLPRRAAGNAMTSNGHVIWRLTRDLGHLAPVWRGTQQVLFDPNSGDLLPVVNATRAPAGSAALEVAP
jgi:hypothetical protein